jgi:heavy metal sensor kinase
MKKLSIGLRLTLWYLAIFALGEFVFGAGMWFILRGNLYDIVDDGLENQMEDLKSFLSTQKPAVSLATLQEAVKGTYSIQHPGDYLALYLDNDLVYRSTFLDAHQSALVPPSQVRRPVERSRRMDDRPFRFLFQKLEVDGRIFTAELGTPADDAVDTLHQFKNYLWLFAPFLLLAAAAGGHWISRKALSPIDELVRTAREVSGTSLGTRLPKLNTGDELQRLSDTLNGMLDRIETAFSRITEFTADASHELRTPVSLIRTEAELALRRARGDEEYRESLRHILVESERTTVLIEQLLSMARADSGREVLQISKLDLQPLLGTVVESWQQVATIRGLQFSADVDVSDMYVMGDEMLLRRLLDIVLDNAFKYTPVPGSVHLQVNDSGEHIDISVRDSGIGIEDREQAKIFERFYRVDKARSRTQGGAGLGLAIGQWIVAQHHGEIKVQSVPGQGSIFRVQLPKAAVTVPESQPAAKG